MTDQHDQDGTVSIEIEENPKNPAEEIESHVSLEKDEIQKHRISIDELSQLVGDDSISIEDHRKRKQKSQGVQPTRSQFFQISLEKARHTVVVDRQSTECLREGYFPDDLPVELQDLVYFLLIRYLYLHLQIYESLMVNPIDTQIAQDRYSEIIQTINEALKKQPSIWFGIGPILPTLMLTIILVVVMMLSNPSFIIFLMVFFSWIGFVGVSVAGLGYYFYHFRNYLELIKKEDEHLYSTGLRIISGKGAAIKKVNKRTY